MKKIITIILTVFLLLNVEIGMGQNCSHIYADTILYGNDVKANFTNNGHLCNSKGRRAYFQVPASDAVKKSTIYDATLWLGAKDNQGNLLVAAQYHDGGRGEEYWPGPLNNQTGLPISCQDYNKVWKVSGVDVQNFRADFKDNQRLDDPIPVSIMAWPGRGNPQSIYHNGFLLPHQDLAPFWDEDQDGIYNPYDGDYPIADPAHPTVIADDLLWMVFNDNEGVHGVSGAAALKAEVQLTAYAFNCNADSVIDRTIFTRHKIINKSTTDWIDFRTSYWADFDLGSPTDDYIGTDVNLNTLYAYNQVQNDFDWPQHTGRAYGMNPPVQAVTFLNQPLLYTMHHENNSTPLGWATNPTEFYHLMNAKFRNGVPLTPDRKGYNPNSNLPATNYIYPDNPNHFAISNLWTMVHKQIAGMDQLVIMTTGKDTIKVAESFELVMAYSYHRDHDSSNLQNINLMKKQVPLVHQYYNNGYNNGNCSPLVPTKQLNEATKEALVKIYPNPTNGKVNLQAEGEIEMIQVFDVLGKLILTTKNIAEEQTTVDLSGYSEGVYLIKIKLNNSWTTKKIVCSK